VIDCTEKEIKMNAKRPAFLTVTSVALFHPLLAFAQQTQQPPWAWPGAWHMWSGGWECGWIFLIFMLSMIVICVATRFFCRRTGDGGRHHWGPCQRVDRSPGSWRSGGDPTHSALQILNERFAKGEIQKQEYEEKKTAIHSRA